MDKLLAAEVERQAQAVLTRQIDDVMSLVNQDKALCYLALQRDPELVLRAAETLRAAAKAAVDRRKPDIPEPQMPRYQSRVNADVLRRTLKETAEKLNVADVC